MNEKEVGEALAAKFADGTVKREDLWITSKLWNTFHRPDLVEKNIRMSLNDLGLDYLDLYLIHWPTAYLEDADVFPRDANGNMLPSDVDYLDTWKAMEELQKKGLTKAIGFSNFNKAQITRVLENCTIKPAVLQIECHPYLNQKRLIEFARSKGIVVTGYSPLGSPDRPWAKPDDPQLLDDVKLKELAKKYKKTPAQIVLRYQIERGVIVIPKSVTKSRIQENFDIFNFKLAPEDVAYIDSLDCNGRTCGLATALNHKYHPFVNDESTSENVVEAVKNAIDVGYRHIDTAYVYMNEKEIGDALADKIAQGNVTRNELWITSKLWNTHHRPDLVEKALQTTLKNLGVDYLDLYLIHWPVAYLEGDEVYPKNEDGKMILSDIDYLDTWKAMEQLQNKGLCKAIGLSNFNESQITRILESCSIKPAVLQVECHPYLNQKKLIEFTESKEIAFTAYSPLGPKGQDGPSVLKEPKIVRLAAKYQKTAAQIVLRYQLDRGLIVIPKSVSRPRIQENFDIFDFKLSPDDIFVIDSLNKNQRMSCLIFGYGHKYHPYEHEN